MRFAARSKGPPRVARLRVRPNRRVCARRGRPHAPGTPRTQRAAHSRFGSSVVCSASASSRGGCAREGARAQRVVVLSLRLPARVEVFRALIEWVALAPVPPLVRAPADRWRGNRKRRGTSPPFTLSFPGRSILERAVASALAETFCRVVLDCPVGDCHVPEPCVCAPLRRRADPLRARHVPSRAGGRQRGGVPAGRSRAPEWS